MKNTKPLNRLLIIWLILFCFDGCKKTDPASIANNIPGGIPTVTDFQPAYTASGVPVDTAVSKTIGAAGGSIISGDGRMQLNIPSGALSANTVITIQPITNECPGGIGVAYDMQPNGTRFAKPASLIFHYTDEELDSTDPYFLYVAYQDSLNEWLSDYVYRDVDTLAKTVTLNISHFTDRSVGSKAMMLRTPFEVHSGETSLLRAVDFTGASAPSGGGSGDDELASLGNTVGLSGVSDWRVNGVLGGNSTVGTVSGNGNAATYTAPASITQRKVVNVSARYKMTTTVTRYNRGKRVSYSQNAQYVRVSGSITLLPNLSYRVLITMSATGTNECFLDNYRDTATLLVDVDGDEVTISEIDNQAPFTKPGSGPSKDGLESCSWVPDALGELNIESGTGVVFPEGNVPAGVEKVVTVNLTGFGVLPKWEITNSGGGKSVTGGIPIPTVPPQFRFHLNGNRQKESYTSPVDPNGYSSSWEVTIVPRF
jgi:hypothetical protein